MDERGGQPPESPSARMDVVLGGGAELGVRGVVGIDA